MGRITHLTHLQGSYSNLPLCGRRGSTLNIFCAAIARRVGQSIRRINFSRSALEDAANVPLKTSSISSKPTKIIERRKSSLTHFLISRTKTFHFCWKTEISRHRFSCWPLKSFLGRSLTTARLEDLSMAPRLSGWRGFSKARATMSMLHGRYEKASCCCWQLHVLPDPLSSSRKRIFPRFDERGSGKFIESEYLDNFLRS